MAKFEFVMTEDGRFLVKVFNLKRWKRYGFAICDSVEAWEGGISFPKYWSEVPPEALPVAEQRRLRRVAEAWGEK